MGQVCLDTSIVIEFVKGNQNIASLIDKFSIFYIPAIVTYEYGRGKLTIEEVKEDLKDFNFINLDINIVLKAIEIYKSLIKRGEIIDDNDIIIGACCIMNNLPLLTLNKKHFEKLKKFGLMVV